MTQLSPNQTSAAPKTHGLFGCVNRSAVGSDDLSRPLEKMERALVTTQQKHCLVDVYSGLGTTGSSASNEQLHSVLIGHPYWHNEDLQAVAESGGPAQAVLATFRQYGENFIEHIFGEFSLLLADSANRRFYAAVDRLTRFPLYYSVTSNVLIVASSAGVVLAHPDSARELDPQGIFNYLYCHMIPSPSTAFKNLYKLPAASVIICDDSGERIRKYWHPDFSARQSSDFNSLKTGLKNSLTTAVSRSVQSAGTIGSFLSGGLDSTTVTGILAEVADRQAPACSIGFAEEGYDEIEYARISAKHFGVKLHEYYVTPEDVTRALPRIATSYDEPFGNSSALPAWFCADFARQQGIEVLLAGDGGDELFAGNERYAKQKLFQHYFNLPSAVKNGLLTPLSRLLPKEKTPLKKLRSYIDQANVPLPDRLQSYNFLHRLPVAEMFSAQFLAEIITEQPLDFMRRTYQEVETRSDLDRMLYLDWQYTLADNDLRKVSHMCALAGIDVRYPMLDDDLVAFSCQVADNLKLKGQKLRYFYKESLRGWLPDATINKSKKGFGLPFGVWLQAHQPLRNLAYDSLGSLKNRDIIAPDFIDQLIKLHRSGHAHYYGEFVWVLVVLEHWLDHHSR